MAVYVGCTGKVVLKATGPSDPAILVSEMNSWTINYAFQAKEFRALGAYYPNRGISSANWSLSLAGYFDYTDVGQVELRAGIELYFEIYPIGEDMPLTQPLMRGLTYIESLDTSGSPDDLIPISISANGTSELDAINTFIGNV